MSAVAGRLRQTAGLSGAHSRATHRRPTRLQHPFSGINTRPLTRRNLVPQAAAVTETDVAEDLIQLEETETEEAVDTTTKPEEADGPTDKEIAAQVAKRLSAEELKREVARRRNFAIISHPDAGKTTLTEKLLLYGGAIHEAGEVKSRKSKKFATSDWMELEKQRGISITSTAMTFEYRNTQINLLDTPGHQDFSEDTYRTLAAADNAVMLVDGAKGLETQTRKLFQVARMRNVPIFTFVNKMDRPAMDPFEIMQQIENEFGLKCYAANWPIGSGDQFRGVWHRPSNKVVLYERQGAEGRRKGAVKQEYEWGDPALATVLEPHLYEKLLEDAELLDALGEPLELDKVASAHLTPMFFGSAVTNFGVELFLHTFIQWAAQPSPSATRTGTIAPTADQFSGLVFKLQANMDPKHRDKVAFIRVVSGKFEKGMKVKVARTGRVVALSRPQRMFANDRSTVQEGFAGDVIGLTNPGAFAIGDTVHTGSTVAFPPIPSFSPELFAYMRCAPNAKKSFLKGIEGLLGEGAVQVLYSTDEYITDPILAAVGQLQFEVVQYRMKDEYGVDTTLDPIPFTIARWVLGGWPAVERAGRLFNTTVVRDMYQRPVLLFRNEFALAQVLGEARDKLGELSPYALPPDV